MASMDNDIRLMDQTEKLVSEMLKSVLTPNRQHGVENEIKVSQTIIEYEIIEETESKANIDTSNVVDDDEEEETVPASNENVFDDFIIEMGNNDEYQNSDDEMMIDLETFISDCLQKIRLEYPMYADASNSQTFGNWENASMPIIPVSSNSENVWCCNPMQIRNDVNGSVYGDHWQNNLYATKEWPQSHVPLLKAINNEPLEASNDSNDDSISDEDDNDDCATNASNVLPAKTTVHCIMTQHERSHLCNKTMATPIIESEISHISVNNNAVSGVTAATGGAATTHVQICAGTPNAIHAAQSTTTTTTTSAGFGVLHQQTSCTTTNFVPNSLANAVLANTPAALYAQSILTSTAHQYLNVFRKEIQQFFTSNNNNNNNIYNATAPTLNLGIYERLLYAQLLQQQILQQQQQQAAIATLLQQQKIVMQNNAANAAAAAAANSIGNNYSNTNVFATTSNASSSSSFNNVGAGISGNNYGYTSNTSLKQDTSSKPEMRNHNASMSAASEDSLASVQKSILE